MTPNHNQFRQGTAGRNHIPVHAYVANRVNPRPAERIVQQSNLPHSARYRAKEYYGAPALSVGTSMLTAHSNTVTSSCPDRTTASSSGDSESVASSMGHRHIDRHTRYMVEGSDGVLRPVPSPARVLECPFKFLRCTCEFAIDKVDDWYRHSLSHFQIGGRRPRNVHPPTSNHCPFCDETFDDADGGRCWRKRLNHVGWHHHAGHTLAHARPDFSLVEYLWQERIIDREDYRELKPQGGQTPQTPLPGSQGSPEPPTGSGAVATIEENRRRDRH